MNVTLTYKFLMIYLTIVTSQIKGSEQGLKQTEEINILLVELKSFT